MFYDRFRADSGFGCEQVGVLRPVLRRVGEVGRVRESYGYLLSFLIVGELGKGMGEFVWERIGDWAPVAEDEFFPWCVD